MHSDDKDKLEIYFDAARKAPAQMSEAARRRILIDAAQMQPKAQPKAAPFWQSWRRIGLFGSAPVGAAMASLMLGVFLGFTQPDSLMGLPGLSSELSAEDGFFEDMLGAAGSAFSESELNG